MLQLKNYKDAKYGLTQVKLVFDSDSLREKLQEGLGMSSQEFVGRFIVQLVDWSSSSNDFNNFARVIEEFLTNTINLLRSMARTPENKCSQLLSMCVDRWVEYSVGEFPKTAAGLSSSEVQFLKKKREYKRLIFIKEWQKQYETVDIEEGGWTLSCSAISGSICTMPCFFIGHIPLQIVICPVSCF